MIENKLYDIFSKKIKKEKRKEKVIIDYREKNSLIPSILIKKNLDIQFEYLKIGDYLVKNIAIERKSSSDLINSIFNNRLKKQLEEIKQYPEKILIIEGLDEKKEIINKNINPIRGFILSSILNYNVPIIFSKNEEETAEYIYILSKKKKKEYPLNVKKKILTKNEQLEFVLESLPKIGPKKARKLLENFKTIKNIINSSENDLRRVIGKDAELIYRLFNEEYSIEKSI